MNRDGFGALQGKQVLVVEDEHLIALALADELEACGAEVIGPATSLTTALDLIGSCAPDAAVLDVQLRNELCYPAADLLIARGTPMIFTTGHDQDSIAPAYTAVPCVQKPATATTVLQALSELF
jgi:CheY-like chemotaxis protein